MATDLTTAERKMSFVRDFVEEGINKGNLSKVDECIAESFVDHNGAPGMEPGPEGVKKAISAFRMAFPDLHFTIDGMMAEGEKVVVRWTGTGTFNSEFLGNPPSGKPITVSGVDIIRMANDKIAERWATYDYLGVLMQLGISPQPAQLPH
jgi:steroid delta-isomerase-like uncharacterized protein